MKLSSCRRLAVLFGLGAFGAGFTWPAWAEMTASVRTLVSIDRPVVKVRDLFRDAGPNADAVLGPAPLPGQRITVGTAQLDAIARRYDVAWNAEGETASVVVQRLGTPITQRQIDRALRSELTRAGAAAHSAITISGSERRMVPLNETPRILVNALHFDPASNDFSATLLITAPAMSAVTMAIEGMASPAAQAVVALHRLSPGEILGSADLKQSWIPVSALPHGAIDTVSQAIGMQVRRMIPKGVPVNDQAIASPTLVARGATVRLVVDLPGLEVTARGIALAAGGAGSVIPVLNPTSHEVVQAVIDGTDRAHVVPGSMPMPARAVPYYQGIGIQQ